MLNLEVNHKTRIRISIDEDALRKLILPDPPDYNTIDERIKEFCRDYDLVFKTTNQTRLEFDGDRVFHISRSRANNSSSGL